MIAKAFVLFASIAAVRAGGLIGSITVPFGSTRLLNTVSSQNTAINHIAPAASLGVAPLGIAAGSLGVHGISSFGASGISSLGIAPGVLGFAAAPLGIASVPVNTITSQRTAINHIAPVRVAAAAPVGIASTASLGLAAAAPVGIASTASLGLAAAAPLGIAAAGPVGIAVAPVNTASSYSTSINHVAPAPRVAIAAAAPIGISAAAPIGIASSAPLGIPVTPFNTVSTQTTSINHVAPAAAIGYAAPAAVGIAPHGIAAPLGIRNSVAAAPLISGLSSARLAVGSGYAAGNLLGDGIVGRGILASRYGGFINNNAVIGTGLLGAGYLGHGNAVGFSKAVGSGYAAGNLLGDGIVGRGILASRYGGFINNNAVIGTGLLGAGYLGHGNAAGIAKAHW